MVLRTVVSLMVMMVVVVMMMVVAMMMMMTDLGGCSSSKCYGISNIYIKTYFFHFQLYCINS